MAYETVIAIVSATAAFASAFFAFVTWRESKMALMHQTLLDFRKDYRSPEMMFAIQSLWDFYRQHGTDKFVAEYERIREEDRKRISSLDSTKRVEAEQSTLHYQRRLVSQFYAMLASAYVNHVLPPKVIYNNWSEPALRIIPQVLVPIENRLREVLHSPPLLPLDDKSGLVKLYNDSTKRK